MSSKLAVLAGAGECPIIIDVCTHFMKYWVRMKSVDENFHNLLKKSNLDVDENNECLEFENILDNDKTGGEETEIQLREIHDSHFIIYLNSDYVNGKETNKLRTFRKSTQNINK